jgi:GR25 family glycosyltransferase involved in LPS biosynthesis
MQYLDKLCFLIFLTLLKICLEGQEPNKNEYVLGGSLLRHLKEAKDKGDHHSMGKIDFIYMINLDQRPEKFLQASEQLHRYGIFPFRFSAVNGWELSLKAINDVGLKYMPGMTPLMASTYPMEAKGKVSHEFMSCFGKTYFCHCTSKGVIGCSLSHISVLKDAYDSGYETVWVLEDDIEVLQDPHILLELIEKLDQLVGYDHWDVLFTDQNYRTGIEKYLIASAAAKRPDMDCSLKERVSEKYTINEDVSADFRKISARFGAHSMIIRRSGIIKLLDFALRHKIFLPYDMDNYLAPGLSRYCLTYDVVTNLLNSLSDNGGPNYIH